MSELTFVATSDLSAITKGRSVLTAEFAEDGTTGWVPANLGIGASGHIVDQIPFGSTGDLRLQPDSSSAHQLTGVPGKPDVTVVFADIVNTDGTPWTCCPRTFLRQALVELESEFGLTMKSAFEHEFVDLDAVGEHHPFSWSNFRKAEPMGSQLVAVMRDSGLQPENWLPEYGTNQYEITVAPAAALAGADRAVLTRDLVRDLFAAYGHRATFTPVVRPGETGSGVHCHFSVTDQSGGNPFYDADRPGRLSELAGRFAAGILTFAGPLAAIYAPFTVSYLRLVPQHWSSARAFLGLHNREALLRLCPTVEIGGRDPSSQLHFEFRGADVGANPWLLLGSLVRAGMEGLRQKMAPATVVTGEVDLQGAYADLPSLPSSLGEALGLFGTDSTVTGWFDPALVDTYLRIKQVELEQLSRMSLTEQCDWYARVY